MLNILEIIQNSSFFSRKEDANSYNPDSCGYSFSSRFTSLLSVLSERYCSQTACRGNLPQKRVCFRPYSTGKEGKKGLQTAWRGTSRTVALTANQNRLKQHSWQTVWRESGPSVLQGWLLIVKKYRAEPALTAMAGSFTNVFIMYTTELG